MKKYISKAKEGISLALGVFQKYFRPGSSPRETEAKREGFASRQVRGSKFHTCKKIYPEDAAQVLLGMGINS